MPIQNIGTLIENIVVTEAASSVLDRSDGNGCVGFVSAFAMPTLSEWRPHAQATGMSSNALDQISRGADGTDFLRTMSRILSFGRDRGPNGVLLAAVLAGLRGARLRVWANDITNGHYGNAIPSLMKVGELANQIVPGSQPVASVAVSDTPYPRSLDCLASTLENWKDIGGLVGFLDPMRYITDSTPGPYSRPSDHRRWLSILRQRTPLAAVHFTGNSDFTSFFAELNNLRRDLVESGIEYWVEFKRQHYVVSVGSPSRELLTVIEERTRSSWRGWCNRVPEIRTHNLDVLRN
jgi:hypothetical protein